MIIFVISKYMLTNLDQYINHPIHIRTSSGLYLKVENPNEHDHSPTFVLITQKAYASEFILIRKTPTNFCIRLNIDMKNQNGTYGYHLYTIPDNDTVYGSGDEGIFAQFQLFQNKTSLKIKSANKNSYLIHDYNVLRCRQTGQNMDFFIDDTFTPHTNNSVCIISYGFARRPIDINNSLLLNNLMEMYPRMMIDLYMFLPDIMDELCAIQYDVNTLKSGKFNVSLKTYKYDIKHFIKLAHSFGLPIINGKSRIYTYRTLSTLWNISESIKFMIATKKIYDVYILLRNDMFEHSQIMKNPIDCNKFYATIDGSVDTHIMIGKPILCLEQIYEFFIKNKNKLVTLTPDQIINQFYALKNTPLLPLYCIMPHIVYPVNKQKYDDAFYRNIYGMYHDLFKCL